jgi:hypothetical protein
MFVSQNIIDITLQQDLLNKIQMTNEPMVERIEMIGNSSQNLL